MTTITELRQKRASLWEQAKKFLDSAKRDGDVLSAEDVAQYEKMESDIVALGSEIDILERQSEMDKKLNAPINTPVLNEPVHTGKQAGTRGKDYAGAFWKAMRNKNSYEVFDALQIGTDSEGGYLVPDDFEATLIDKLNEENIIRSLATVVTSSNGDKKIPVVASHGTAEWIEEGAAYKESDDAFTNVILTAHKLSTIIKVSEELLNDSAFDLESYIAQEFARRLGSAEEDAFITGDGSGKPSGILGGAETGVTAASGAALTMDEVVDLYHSLRAPYRKNAVFIANDSTIKAIRKIKDASGQYIWQPSVQTGQPDTILNRPIYTSSYMPEIGASNKVLIFGDLKYYWISDRQGRTFQRLNELYAQNGQVGFRVFQRVDGKLILPEAVKTLVMGG